MSSDANALAKLLRPLSRGFTTELARALASLKADEEIQTRYDELAQKRTEGKLSPEEEEELESIVRANSLLGLLKAEAQAFLAQSQSS